MKTEQYQIFDSYNSHLKSKMLNLYEHKIKNRKVIYLDTKYWLILRDQLSSELNNSLLNNIYKLHKSGNYIFPISDITFLEILKQTDPITRNKTINLIDTLSEGITSISSLERLKLEVMIFFGKAMGMNLHNIKEMLMTKLSFILGKYIPPYKFKKLETTIEINEKFLDHLWELKLNKIVEYLNLEEWEHHEDNTDYLNHQKTIHLNDHKSFKSLYMTEIGGILDSHETLINKAIKDLYYYYTGNEQEYKKESENDNKIKNLLYHSFKLNKIKTELPLIDIPSGLFAAVRWDKKKNHHKNDTYDFLHASFALPYSDYFFTEKHLKSLITNGNLKYDQKYNCKVLAKLKDVEAEVKNIADNI